MCVCIGGSTGRPCYEHFCLPAITTFQFLIYPCFPILSTNCACNYALDIKYATTTATTTIRRCLNSDRVIKTWRICSIQGQHIATYVPSISVYNIHFSLILRARRWVRNSIPPPQISSGCHSGTPPTATRAIWKAFGMFGAFIITLRCPGVHHQSDKHSFHFIGTMYALSSAKFSSMCFAADVTGPICSNSVFLILLIRLNLSGVQLCKQNWLCD